MASRPDAQPVRLLAPANGSAVGDIAYADSWLKEEKAGYITPLNTTDRGTVYDRILNEFYDEVEELSKTKPYMVGPGKPRCSHASPDDMVSLIWLAATTQATTRPTATTAAICLCACPAS